MGKLPYKADLILVNGRVMARDRAKGASQDRPSHSAVAVRAGRIAEVGDTEIMDRLRGPATRILDCQGGTVLPGFIDAHMHLFAFAANLLGVDCSPNAVSSIQDVLDAVRGHAAATPAGAWIRAWGLEEFHLAEGRVPTRWELDRAAPNHPVKLLHRSGHASILNSSAMALLGITVETPDPLGGLIDRDPGNGEPTGYFLEMERDLEARGAPTLSPTDLERGIALARDRLLSLGVTSIHEATPSHDLSHWDMLAKLKERDALPIRVYKMFGSGALDSLAKRGLAFRAGDTDLRIGAIKLVLNESGDRVLPPPGDLADDVRRATLAGFQIAFHAVEERGIEAACASLETAGGSPGLRQRIEHCGVCPPELVQRLGRLGVLAVTQPGFLWESGDRYLAQVPAEKQRWLYPIASLGGAGIRVAFGSDCPVASPDPMRGLVGAVTRRSRSGAAVTLEETVSLELALRMYTAAGAYAAFEERQKGRIAAGYLADLVVLKPGTTPGPPNTEGGASPGPTGIEGWRAAVTIIGGEVMWEA